MKNKNLFFYIILLIAFGLAVVIISHETLSTLQELSVFPKISVFLTRPTEQPLEIINGIVIVRELDKELIGQKIEQGKEYLLRMIDEKENGAHKYYYALDDSFENRLHTIYTSSLIYTLLNLYNFKNDNALLGQIFKSGEFVLSMQNKAEGTKGYGAFYYSYFKNKCTHTIAKKGSEERSDEGSYYLDSKEREKKFVVGTTSKTIFTLLRLYKLTNDSKYLESAKLGADWLVTMQNPDGSMTSYVTYKDGKWFHSTKESLLYDGQVLSALSKIYIITGEEKYYDSAEKIAKRFAEKYEEAGRKYIEGEYRSKNPISNSWVVMSFIDFYKTNKDDYYKDIIFALSTQIISEQRKDPNDILNYGCIGGSYSTSGNGWISEVMTDTYSFCLEQNRGDCEKYKNAVVNIIRWLIQYTYSKENSSFLENSERAIGGIFWNKENKYVRTDSVCHGLNGYIGIIDYLNDNFLLSVPKN